MHSGRAHVPCSCSWPARTHLSRHFSSPFPVPPFLLLALPCTSFFLPACPHPRFFPAAAPLHRRSLHRRPSSSPPSSSPPLFIAAARCPPSVCRRCCHLSTKATAVQVDAVIQVSHPSRSTDTAISHQPSKLLLSTQPSSLHLSFNQNRHPISYILLIRCSHLNMHLHPSPSLSCMCGSRHHSTSSFTDNRCRRCHRCRSCHPLACNCCHRCHLKSPALCMPSIELEAFFTVFPFSIVLSALATTRIHRTTLCTILVKPIIAYITFLLYLLSYSGRAEVDVDVDVKAEVEETPTL